MIDVHGFDSCGLISALYTGWREKAAEEGFVAVWPNGRGASWNAGGCCGFAQAQGVDDVGFINAVVQQTLATHAAVDPQRVYAAGHSNGCMMAQRLAAEESSPFAAVGCHSGQLLLSDSQLPRPFTPAAAVMVVHGKEDAVNPFDADNPLAVMVALPGALPNINRCRCAELAAHCASLGPVTCWITFGSASLERIRDKARQYHGQTKPDRQAHWTDQHATYSCRTTYGRLLHSWSPPPPPAEQVGRPQQVRQPRSGRHPRRSLGPLVHQAHLRRLRPGRHRRRSARGARPECVRG